MADQIISEALQQVLAAEASQAEAQGKLTDRQLAIIQQEGWFRMFLPLTSGGLELSLPQALRIEEALACIDGSLGWTVTLCSGAVMFAGFLERELSEELLSNPDACFGGSGASTGTAAIKGDHYLINGHWKYATGAPHLTAFTANCRVMEHGEPVIRDGKPLMRAFIFHKHEVIIDEDWHTMGLRATASHSFEINDLLVPNERAFDILQEAATLSEPIFQYPFLPFAETTLAVNTSGMALHFLDCCEAIFEGKGRSDTDVQHSLTAILDKRKNRLEQLRNRFYELVDHSWSELSVTRACSPELIKEIGIASRNLHHGAITIVQELFPLCGMQAVNPDAEINRIWRDIFTASQHSLLRRCDNDVPGY